MVLSDHNRPVQSTHQTFFGENYVYQYERENKSVDIDDIHGTTSSIALGNLTP